MARKKVRPVSAKAAALPPPSRNRELLAALALVLLVILAYSRAPFMGFIWDDDSYVTLNATLRSLSGLWSIWAKLAATPQYYPLVHTTFWIEYHLWGLNPIGFHVVNVLLHALSVVLLWRILLRLEIPGAWFAAALFAVHPVQVESVAWVTERKNVLCGVFYFASALVYLRWLGIGDLPGKHRRENHTTLYLAAFGFFLLALLSKTVACTLPAAILLVQWWKNDGRLVGRDFIRLLPYFVVGASLGLLTAWVERHHVHAEGEVWALSFAQRVMIAGRALWFYAGKLVWPAKLSFLYPHWSVNAADLKQWLFPLSAGAVVLGLFFWRNRWGRGPLVGVLFFVITLAPALGFFNVYPFRYSFVADHFQYLATVGLLVLVAVALVRLPQVLLGVILVLGLLTWRQTAIYRNLEILWRDTIRKNPECWMAYNNLAKVVLAQGNKAESLAELEKAYSLHPNEFEIERNYGWVLLENGRADEALPHLTRAVEFGTIDAPVHYYLGTAYYRGGRLTEAKAELQNSLAIDPHYVPAGSELGAILLSEGRSNDALILLETAVAEDPDFLSARFNLANTLIQLGRQKEAVEQLKQAFAAHPDNAQAQKNLAWVLATSPDDGVREGPRAVELAESARRETQGRDPVVLITLSAAYAEAGRFSDAITSAEEALKLATDAGNTSLAQGIHNYITLYQYSQPIRDTR